VSYEKDGPYGQNLLGIAKDSRNPWDGINQIIANRSVGQLKYPEMNLGVEQQ
jgi:hypothetical protein